MDFFRISTKETKGGTEVYPDFIVGRSKDLMVRGKSFYALWDLAENRWTTDEYDVQRLVDEELRAWCEKNGHTGSVKYMRSFGSNAWVDFRRFMTQVSDNSHQLDDNLTFANTATKKTDYVSRRLPYSLIEGDHSAWDDLIGVLYAPEEKAKIEWAIGSIISGDSKKLQKFLVFYGPGGTGKSTVLNIIEQLFSGYTTSFEAKALAANGNSFATEAFKGNPLVAIQHDGDLSKIADNTKINSLVSHEKMTFNEKFKPSYDAVSNALLLMGTNQPVLISDAKSGIIRRLIDVRPTGDKLPPNQYHALMARIDFELGAIAYHCLEVYRKMGKNYYNTYRPTEMMFQTDIMFNFVEACYDVFSSQDGVTLKQAYAMYKEFCADTGIDKILPQYKVREELKNYFEEFGVKVVDDEVRRNYFSGFKAEAFKAPVNEDNTTFSLVMDETVSLLDEMLAGQPAQYGNDKENPAKYWTDEERLIDGVLKKPKPSQIVSTVLSDLDTSKLHFVKVPENHIVIDFDLKDDSGAKSLERNLAEASTWPATYAEVSKSEAGVHLHYLYSGDPSELAPSFADGIEIKAYRGNASLRRRLSRCNNVPVAVINSGLPLKEKTRVLSTNTIKSEKGLRDLIERNLRKEIHASTKSSIDFIKVILDDMYKSGEPYDVENMRSRIVLFALKSSNHGKYCMDVVTTMPFKSEPVEQKPAEPKDERLVFFDVECFRNLFLICWSFEGDENISAMINPSPEEVEKLFQFKLVGFNCRGYDNHMIWARFLGYSIEKLYELSQQIIVHKNPNAKFAQAYNLSYADIYDFTSLKQGLKKYGIDLGLHHIENQIPWDEPVPDEKIAEVVEYCCNDVRLNKAVFKAREQDFVARQILAELSGLTVNDTTQQHTAQIIFGNERKPQKDFVYTDLSKEFPGYVYDFGKSSYRGEDPSEGGYVYAEPGMYTNVSVFDVESMHPTSIEQLDLFGRYTPNFVGLLRARLAIKHGDYDSARGMLDGKLEPYLKDENAAEELSYALKIVINTVYGLTSAKFDNRFRDVRNKDNIVAKRGALFMIDAKHFVQERGFKVVHIKTDSIKIVDATPELIDELMMFGEKYGYTFEHEATYEKFCLVNDAVYIAKYGWAAKPKKIGTWSAVGTQFQHPYIFKKLFTGESVLFNDLCETKQVTKGAMYLDFTTLERSTEASEGMRFIGRTGRFVPVREGCGGGTLYRVFDGKNYAVSGTKGFLWVEADVALTHGEDTIDMNYFEQMAEKAKATINTFAKQCDSTFEEFVN